jgi:AcrR family transcriptional regulator
MIALTTKALTASPRLRSGRGGPPRGEVAEIQRTRMLAAAVDAVAEVGYGRMTVAEVIARARVSRKTFYDVFNDREHCFFVAFEEGVERASRLAREAYANEQDWRSGVRAALARVLALMDEEPHHARLCVVEALGAGEQVLERRARLLAEVAAVIDQGRLVPEAMGGPPAVTAEGIVGAISSVLYSRLFESSSEPLADLLGPLMSVIVLPFLGARAAGHEMRGQLHAFRGNGRGATRSTHWDPLKSLNMRLTYRTARVLAVIAEQPGASNRAIAEGSGVTDQGQISKLLTRLARLELVENLGEGHLRGAANAWYLTRRGSEVEAATRTR